MSKKSCPKKDEHLDGVFEKPADVVEEGEENDDENHQPASVGSNLGKPQKSTFLNGPTTKALTNPAPPPTSSLVVIHFSNLFLDLKKSSFSSVVWPLPLSVVESIRKDFLRLLLESKHIYHKIQTNWL